METQDTAIVLHSRRYRENSRIVELFTKTNGRVAVVARISTRRSGTQLNQYQPFHELFVTWAGRGELKSLRTTELVDYWDLAGKASICGLYLNELLLYLVGKGLPMDELYQTYSHALNGLQQGHHLPATLRAFEKNLLQDLGYLPSLMDDAVTGDELDVSLPLFFSPSHGASHQKLPDAFRVSPEALLALVEENWAEKSTAKEIKMMLGSSINRLLNGKTLRSRELIQTLSQKKI